MFGFDTAPGQKGRGRGEIFDYGKASQPSPRAMAELRSARRSYNEFIGRHARGDWGQVSPAHVHRNDQNAMAGKGPVSSRYQLGSVVLVVATNDNHGRTDCYVEGE